MQLLRTIAFIIIFYYLFRFLARIFGPVLFRYASKKAQEQYQERHQARTQGGGNREMPKEGEVVIENTPENIRKQRTSKPGKKVGEYIDFEEID